MFTTSSIRKTLTPSRRSLHNHPSPSPNGYVDLHLHSWETAGRTGDRVVPPLLRSYDERHAWRNARRDSNHQAHHLPLLLPSTKQVQACTPSSTTAAPATRASTATTPFFVNILTIIIARSYDIYIYAQDACE